MWMSQFAKRDRTRRADRNLSNFVPPLRIRGKEGYHTPEKGIKDIFCCFPAGDYLAARLSVLMPARRPGCPVPAGRPSRLVRAPGTGTSHVETLPRDAG